MTWLIVCQEWRYMLRSAIAVYSLGLLLLLSTVAAITAMAIQQKYEQQRTSLQASVDNTFDNQPNRHPHRVVHFGQFVFKPRHALAAIDIGISDYTGQMIYLEGHRQNSANFGDVRQSSFLLRFGQLTPALVLQILAPLVLIFMGFNSVVRERELGMLRLLQMSGVALTRLVWAKALALLVVVGIMLMPLAAALLYLGLFEHAGVINSLLMFGSYALYLCTWLVLVLIVSTISQCNPPF